MAMIGVILNPGNTGAEVQELHVQLLADGAVLDPGEQGAANFGPTTVAAVRAFRQRHGLPAGDTVDPPAARLMHVASAYADRGSRVPLNAAVREAAAATDASQPQELYWLARYAILARDYETAHSVAQRIPDHNDIKAVIEPILTLPAQPALQAPEQLPIAPQPRPPELPYPENFYTYRRDFYPLGVLEDLQRKVAEVDPGDPLTSQGQKTRTAVSWFEALKQWQIGNAAFNHRNYDVAQAAYDACQSAACDFFSTYYREIAVGNGSLTERLSNLIKHLASNETLWPTVWSKIRWRRGLLSLEELGAWDWPGPLPIVGTLPPSPDFGLRFIQQYFQKGEFGDDPATPARENDLEAPLITLAFVLAPLARAEANRARHQYDAAIRDLRWVLNSVQVGIIPPDENPGPIRFVFARLACEFIELPFAKVLLAETLLDKADAEYKARIAADPPPAPDVAAFQGLKAAQTYLTIKALFGNEGKYVERVDASREELAKQVQQRLAVNDTRSPEFQLLGKNIYVPTITSASGATLPGLDRRMKAHEPLLKFTPPEGQTVLRETNPRIYAVLLTATARLEQLKAGFNYLGYLDTYVPPWRFQFLLERARYFAEHAKNAQREYLNFLSNAEREEFQEFSASQNVEMEKSNVRIETARVDQVMAEVAAAQQSEVLAEQTAKDAAQRRDKYKEFDEYADMLFGTGDQLLSFNDVELTSRFFNALPLGIGAHLDRAGTEIGDFFSHGVVSQRKHLSLANKQREVELLNLDLAASEASLAAKVARAQLEVAKQGGIVAGLQRQAALLRHENAVQNLQFLRIRNLNAEQWLRLANAIRGVADTYLRYAIELAFLAEQAYEFEANERINVIRFDYDQSEVGDYLAADFLLRDLDTIEQDFIVNQRQRQQQVRYVLSLAREFPAALEELRETGKMNFMLRLEQIEKRFPGLYNVRVGMVEVLPVALMDSTRFSLDLTHMGSGQLRIKGQPDVRVGEQSTSVLNVNDLPDADYDWTKTPKELWPVKILVNEPETAVFSGLSRQDAASAFPVASSGQRNAFEGRALAGGWEIDMAARENQVVPGSLADLQITFTVSGYHDPGLRAAIDATKPQTTALTSFLSARQIFPDAFYDFSRTGRMVWKVPRAMLAPNGDLGRLRNIGMSLRPGPLDVHFSRLMTRLRINFRVNQDAAGNVSGVTVFTFLPVCTITQPAPMTVQVSATTDAPSELAWDFGDGSPVLPGVSTGTPPKIEAAGSHVYTKPGRHVIKLRCVRGETLSEFRFSVVVSRTRQLGELLFINMNRISVTPEKTIRFDAGGAVQQASRKLWRVDGVSAEGNNATFTLKPGNYTLDFTAVRKLNFRAYGAQRYFKDSVPLPLQGFTATTNRTFDEHGNETNGTGTPPLPARNELAKRLFDKGAISPEDDWTFELIPHEIMGLPPETAIGAKELDLSEIQDVVLSMEYETTPGGP